MRIKHLIGFGLFAAIVGATHLISAYTAEPEFRFDQCTRTVTMLSQRTGPVSRSTKEVLPEITSKVISFSYDLRTRSFTAVFELSWNRNIVPEDSATVEIGLTALMGEENEIIKTFYLTEPFKKGTKVTLKRSWKASRWKGTAEAIQSSFPVYYGNVIVRPLTSVRPQTLVYREPNYLDLSVPITVVQK